MVDLSGAGPDGPLEHGFSNSVFIVPTIITVALIVLNMMEAEDDTMVPNDGIDHVKEALGDPTHLLKMLDDMPDMSEEEKEDIRNYLTGKGKHPLEVAAERAAANPPIEYLEPDGFNSETILIYIIVLAVVFSMAFFGYKLYKSIAEKERKKEDKKKMKAGQKKKK